MKGKIKSRLIVDFSISCFQPIQTGDNAKISMNYFYITAISITKRVKIITVSDLIRRHLCDNTNIYRDNNTAQYNLYTTK